MFWLGNNLNKNFNDFIFIERCKRFVKYVKIYKTFKFLIA